MANLNLDKTNPPVITLNNQVNVVLKEVMSLGIPFITHKGLYGITAFLVIMVKQFLAKRFHLISLLGALTMLGASSIVDRRCMPINLDITNGLNGLVTFPAPSFVDDVA
jgi:hypothetical protein